MFEVAELGHKMSKNEFETAGHQLQTSLLQLQRDLRKSDKAVVIIVSGVEGAGKGSVVKLG